ncbi:MAG: phosphoenolpyruvate carboxykinase (ATP) [Magnetococcus sp. DMHC-6]
MNQSQSQQARIQTVTEQLTSQGIVHFRKLFLDLSAPELYEQMTQRQEGYLAAGGPIVVTTGIYTGRSANDKYIVDEPSCHEQIAWGEVNRPFNEIQYDRLRSRMTAFLQGRDLFVQECRVGANLAYQRKIRIISVLAWHSLLARNLFIHPREFNAPIRTPDYTLIVAPTFKADPAIDGTRSEAFIILHLGRREILIGGTAYGGEIKKAVFTTMNYLLPQQGVLPMHCSANVGINNESALFFGLSGTGKTTLSTDPNRRLIGDDEHGWSNNGIFNFEGGCYAKVIRLSAQNEPEIWDCTRKFGTILENVMLDTQSRRVDLDNDEFTENSRATYSLSSLSNIQPMGQARHPDHVILLTADAFGILPPVSQLTQEQAMYHFLSGYTAKLAGTERGQIEPKATFSSCFGAPFMPLDPVVYANMLGKKLNETKARCWLVNTGWIGGPYGHGGERMPIQQTRAIIHQILANRLNEIPTRTDPIFGLQVPLNMDEVDNRLLDPRSAWDNPHSYDEHARILAKKFTENFKQFADRVPESVQACNPR